MARHKSFAGTPEQHNLDAANNLHQAARNLGTIRKIRYVASDCAPVLDRLRWVFQDLSAARTALYGYDQYRTHAKREKQTLKLEALERTAMKMWKDTFVRCGIAWVR
jgi:hypothetical protein